MRRLAVLLALAALASPGTATANATGDCTANAGWGTLDRGFAAQVLDLVNAHRASLGLTRLTSSAPLAAAAEWKSLHMAGYGYMTHEDPAPPAARTVGQRLEACGYSGHGWGENIAYGYRTPEQVMDGWLHSPGHRANIEDPSYRAIGIGAARSASGVLYWTQDFGTAADAPPSRPPRRPRASSSAGGRRRTRPRTASTSALVASERSAHRGSRCAACAAARATRSPSSRWTRGPVHPGPCASSSAPRPAPESRIRPHTMTRWRAGLTTCTTASPSSSASASS